MKKIYKFIAGNSRITPFGIGLAVALALALQSRLGWWSAPLRLDRNSSVRCVSWSHCRPWDKSAALG